MGPESMGRELVPITSRVPTPSLQMRGSSDKIMTTLVICFDSLEYQSHLNGYIDDPATVAEGVY